ncbi:MAG: alpha/beta hydrolase, partial [Oligoflexia bacterium]|nr:alpha/beta hydrolase [Oligoflexia bacterium]
TGPTRPPVLLVHGFAQNRYSWHNSHRSWTAWLAQRGWDTWDLELRGHGRSRKAGVSGAEVFSDYVLDVRLAAAALPGPAFWIGHSLGGAALFAAAAEMSTAAQVAAEPLPLGIVGIGAVYSFAQSNRFLKLLGQITHSFRDAPWMSAVQVRTRLAGRLLSRIYGVSDIAGYAFPISGWWPGSIEPAVLQERLELGLDWTSVKVWQEMARWAATGRFEWDEAWSQTDLPLLVIAGDKDHLMPPPDAKVAYARSGSRDRTWQVFDDWHHDVHWGHLDLVLGRLAPIHVWPLVDAWMASRMPR